MAKRLKISILTVILLLVWVGVSTAFERIETLDRGLRNNDAYAHSLVLKSKQFTGQERLDILKEAVEHAPDTPSGYFALAWATIPNFGQSAVHLVDGVKTYSKSIWWINSIKGLIVMSALLAMFVSIAIIAVFRFIGELPKLVHDINESKVKLLIPLILIPAAVLGPVVFLGALLVLPGLYMRKEDKWVVYLYFILIAALPLYVGFVDSFHSISTPTTRALVDVNEGRDNYAALRVLRDKDGFVNKFAYATALKREGMPLEAAAIFNGIINVNPDPRVYINLGNAYVAAGQMDKSQKPHYLKGAKTAYENALAKDRSVLALYNISQAYRDNLEYPKGDKFYEEARKLDPIALSAYQELKLKGKSYNSLVVDARMTQQEIMAEASLVKLHVMPLVPDVKGTAAGGVGLFLLFLILDMAIKSKAFRCAKCDRIACDTCTDPGQPHDPLCSDCLHSGAGDAESSAKERVARMLQANEEKSRMVTVLRVLSVFPPGIAQVVTGRINRAFIFMFTFIFTLSVILMDPYFPIGLAGGTHKWLWLILIPVMGIDYLISIITINRRLNRGWL